MNADYSFYVKTIETYARKFLTLDILAIGRVMCSSQKLLNGIYCPCTPVSTSANALLTGYKQRFDNQSRSCNQGCSQYNSTCLYIEYRPTYPLYCDFFLWITLVQERTLEYGCTMIHKPLLITFTHWSFYFLYSRVFMLGTSIMNCQLLCQKFFQIISIMKT